MRLSQPVYIYGAATFGKTELVRHFFSNREYTYISCANTVDFNNAAAQAGITGTLVIDDLHLLRDDSARSSILELLQCIGCHVVMVSRSQVPAWLVPAYIKQGFAVISQEDLCIDPNEIAEGAKRCNLDLSTQQLEFIESNSLGNAYSISAALRKLREGRRLDNKLVREIRAELMDYIIEYVIAQWDSDVTEFMTKLSVADEFNASLAEYITGNSRVASALKKRWRRAIFSPVMTAFIR